MPQIEPQAAHHQKITSDVVLIADISALPHFLHGGEGVRCGSDVVSLILAPKTNRSRK
jgi:hypothetical protein